MNTQKFSVWFGKNFWPVLIAAITVAVLALAAAGAIYWRQRSAGPSVPPSPSVQICTGQVKVCSDGTKIYPAGPNCELAACPAGGTLTPADIMAELEKLNIKTAGPAVHETLRLFPPSSGANLAAILKVCGEGGYALSLTARVRTFTLTSYPIDEKYGNEPLEVRILSRGDKIFCVYKSVREGSAMAPGIFSVKGAPSASPAPAAQ